MAQALPPPPRRRLRWGRGPLIAVVVAGVVAVVLIATIHPWALGPAPAKFTLSGLDVSLTGSGASGVTVIDVCLHRCPATVSVGEKYIADFTVNPKATVTCGDSTYFSVTKVKETTTGGAFSIENVSADAKSVPLPITIPYPLTGASCVTTAEIWVTFSVSDHGAPSQTPALVATVTES